jgi:cell wall-associated NlpC family hydrolase
MLSRRRADARRLLAVLLLTLTLTPIALVSTSPAEATTLGQRAVAEASRHRGKPYQYGAVGPYKFDCSGFTLYVFSRFGRRLPHSSAQQYNAAGVRHIAKSSRALGDLIFMRSSTGRITHVGIYAGSNRWWVAPKTGDHVKLQTLYSTNYVVGRVA